MAHELLYRLEHVHVLKYTHSSKNQTEPQKDQAKGQKYSSKPHLFEDQKERQVQENQSS